MHRRGPENLHSLTAISNNAGVAGKGGLDTLTQARQVNRLILSDLGNNRVLENKYLAGDIAIELCPQGTLAERLRAGGAGILAFFTATGARECLNATISWRARSLVLKEYMRQILLSRMERFPFVWTRPEMCWSKANLGRPELSTVKHI